MGEVFKVLIQHKGIDKPALDGLRDLRSISGSFQREGSDESLRDLRQSAKRGGNTEILLEEALRGQKRKGRR